MYAYIKGIVVDKSVNCIILESNNIGYELLVSTNTSSTLVQGQEAKVYTYLQAKEDGITFFGFISNEEKQLFLKLISVSGVGGKTALQILSGAPTNDLILSIMNNDISILKRIKGIGKKTAERIVLELNEKVDGVSDAQFSDGLMMSSGSSIIEDAIMALTNLGLTKKDAEKLVKKFYKGNETTEELIMTVLRNMG